MDNIYKMKLLLIFTAVLLINFTSCKNTKEGTSHKTSGNHLSGEISPYLLQHAHNPVDWYPWKDEALKIAADTRKLMIISIGYSSCHWCHVMERESFSDTAVSNVMNAHFISIKVDREERPDVDQIYMNACQIINSGACGWPLNAITLPDGRPVWVGTYLTKDEWLRLLKNMQDVYAEDPNELEKMAMQIQSHLSVDYSRFGTTNQTVGSEKNLKNLYDKTIQSLDFVHGGKKSSQKFPLPPLMRSLLEYQLYSNNVTLDKFNTTTLNKIADGGIYDHLEGGFSRYTVDPEWKVPHFEKMLYDNAQLISLYAMAYQKTGNEKYKNVIDKSLDFIKKNLTHPDGSFYSSLDAETEGEEGKYYVWTEKEINEGLGAGPDLEIFKYTYGIREGGNWEKGKNVLFTIEDVKSTAKKFKKPESEITQSLNNSRNKLLQLKSNRKKPKLDDKILTAWNALMIRAYTDASAALGNEEYLNSAIKAADLIRNRMWDPQKGLFRNYKDGQKSINGFLEDYSFTIDAFIRLYELSFDESYLLFAKQLTDITIQNFSDPNNLFFYFNSKEDKQLISRKMDFEDQVTPSANSVMADNLYRLGLYFYNNEYLQRSKKMILSACENFGEGQTEFYSNWTRLYITLLKPYYEVAVVGTNSKQLRNDLAKSYLPYIILLGGTTEGTLELLKDKLQEGNTFIYVCRNKVCKIPVQDAKEALKLIN